MNRYFSELNPLPPTCSDLHFHIRGCVNSTYVQFHCLQNMTIDSTNVGYGDRTGFLVPFYYQSNAAESLIQTGCCNTVHAEILVPLAELFAMYITHPGKHA